MASKGTQANSHRLATIEDLDVLLAKHSLAPTIIRLGGAEYTIRTDLSFAECMMFRALSHKEMASQALTVLTGTKAERDALAKAVKKSEAGEEVQLPAGKVATKLDAFLDTLPRLHVSLMWRQITVATKVMAGNAMAIPDIYRMHGFDPPVEEAETVETGESSAS